MKSYFHVILLFLFIASGFAAAPLRFDAEKVAVDPKAFTQNNSRPPVGKWDFFIG